MTVDYLVIGQGICGTFLSYDLLRAGKSVFVIDDANPLSATRVASGVINPVTGRRVVTVWMADTLMPFVLDRYTAIGKEIGEDIIEQKNIISFSSSVQMMESYRKRLHEANSYISSVASPETYAQWFNFVFECFEINPVYLINLQSLQAGWRAKLIASGSLLETKFEETDLAVHDDAVQYKKIHAQKIIFCNGIKSYNSSYWKKLPYILNKGEALIVSIPGLAAENIYKFGALTIVPWQNDLWWVGSSYENEFNTIEPTESFRKSFTAALQSILKIPFTITDHFAAVRPAALERRPFVGIHPYRPSLGILNGMGTKGCSLAPYFSKQLTDALTNGQQIDSLADIKRFSRILQ